MKTTHALFFAPLFGAAVATALAQAPGRLGPRGDRPPLSPILEALDLNQDGRVDATELAQAGESLKTLDRDKDGQLSAAELRPQFPGGRGPGGPGDFGGPLRGRGRGPEGSPPRGGFGGGSDFGGKPLPKNEAEKAVLTVLADMLANQRGGSMSVPEDDGRILRLLVESLGAKNVVEIGTSVGYSGVWIGLGLQQTGGKLTTFEIDEGRAAQARENFRRAGLNGIITLVLGDAHEKVAALRDPIDLIFLDADKDGYLDYLQKLLPLVRPGGLIVAHNISRQQADPAYVKAITTDPNLETVFLNLSSSGISVTMKKR